MNKPIAAQNGDLILPATWAHTAPDIKRPLSEVQPQEWFNGCTGNLQGAAISGDKGKSWKLYGSVEAPDWAVENMIVERIDGSLWMLIRTGSGCLWESLSTDGGVTWTASRQTKIRNPGTRFFIGRLKSGRILLISSPNPKGRTKLSAYLSEDDGKTFSHGLQIDKRDKRDKIPESIQGREGFLMTGPRQVKSATEISYPDAVEGPDGIIYAVYDSDRHGKGEIIICSFTESDILA